MFPEVSMESLVKDCFLGEIKNLASLFQSDTNKAILGFASSMQHKPIAISQCLLLKSSYTLYGDTTEHSGTRSGPQARKRVTHAIGQICVKRFASVNEIT